jgi:hypothetical protein
MNEIFERGEKVLKSKLIQETKSKVARPHIRSIIVVENCLTFIIDHQGSFCVQQFV